MSTLPTKDQVFEALTRVIDPEIRKDVVELRMVRNIEITDSGEVTVEIALTTPGCPLKASFQQQVASEVGAIEGVTATSVRFGVMSQQQKQELREQLSPGRGERAAGIALSPGCRVIAVASGKGGVGKSTLTVNLAAAMARLGHEVGVLDADVYGYSIPTMLGIHQRPVTVEGLMVPPVAHDVRLMSIGFFLDEDEPVMWRGPMLHRALEQFLADVHWGEIEYLFVDMPPGTGDVAISLGQLLPRAEVVVVTTPQPAAQVVAQRAALMADRMDQRLIGVIENMADVEGAPSVFGRGGGQLLADNVGTRLLGTVPLDAAVREGGDAGAPLALGGEGAAADALREIARAIEAIEPPAPPAPEGAGRIKKPLAIL